MSRVLNYDQTLRTFEKCRKYTPADRVFYISLVFSNARRVLSQCNTQLRLLYLRNKEDLTVLCSVVKHAGSGRARKKCRGKRETQSSVYPHFLGALPLPKCFTTEESPVEASLFVF